MKPAPIRIDQSRDDPKRDGHAVTKLSTAQSPTQAVLTLDSFDKQIDTLEFHQREGAPWTTRFGLNRDSAARRALAELRRRRKPHPRWSDPSGTRTTPAPAMSLSDAQIASGGNAQVQAAYDTLKAYLMLAKPQRGRRCIPDTATRRDCRTRPPRKPVAVAGQSWEDLRHHTIAFFASHLGRDTASNVSALAIVPDGNLIASTRQRYWRARHPEFDGCALPPDRRRSYAQVLADYPRHAARRHDESRSVQHDGNRPRRFTRAAWEERISKSIDDASAQRDVSGDWVKV